MVYADYQFYTISIHAPTKGATAEAQNIKLPRYIFQSTLPRRERRCDRWPCYFGSGFQSTLPRRERPLISWRNCRHRTFQSTLPRRERRVEPILITSPFYFNPRSHEGSDGILHFLTGNISNFNPRSHEGSDFG